MDQMNTDRLSQTDSQEVPITKAGIILFERPKYEAKGRGTSNALRMLIGMSNRYGEGVFHTLCKGSLDLHLGETPRAGAARETAEETGFSIEKLMGPESFREWLEGKEIGKLESKEYAGMQLVHAAPEPVVDHTYVSRYGKKHRVVLYGVEVKGIEHARPYLKGWCGEGRPIIWEDTEKLAVEHGLPDASTRLEIMRTGRIPAQKGAEWADPEKTITLFERPALAEIEARSGKRIETLAAFAEMVHSISGDEYKPMAAQISALKDYLTEKKLISDGSHPFKFDALDRPLRMYSEKAAIQTGDEILRESYAQMKKSPLYEGSMWGGFAGKPGMERTMDEKIMTSQIGGLLEFIGRYSPMDIAAAAIGQCDEHHHEGTEKPDLAPYLMRVLDLHTPNNSGWEQRIWAESPKARNR